MPPRHNHLLLAISLSILLSACTAGRVREPFPEWTQRPEEVGKLPVGKVIGVERVDIHRNEATDAGTRAGMQATAGAVGVYIGLPIIEGIKGWDWFYRYRIRMATGEERIADQFEKYNVGSCVAFRQGLQADSWSMIPALENCK